MLQNKADKTRARPGPGRWLRGLVLVAMAPLAAAGPSPMPPGHALKAAADAPSAVVRKTEALIAAGDATGLGRHLAALKGDPGLSEPARERLLRRTLLGLAAMKADAGTRAQVAALVDYPPSVLVSDTEHGHAETRALFNVAAAARFVERRWAETDARDAAAAALAAGDPAPLGEYPAGDDPTRRGILEAFREAGAPALASQRPALVEALTRGDDVGALALEAAARLADESLYTTVLAEADDRTAVAAVRRLATAPAGLDPTPLLIAAAARPEAASAALIALGDRAVIDPAAERALFDRLGSETGASAAAALARTADPAMVDRLAVVLFSDADERTRRHALLGLRLAGPHGASHLRRYAADPATPADLRLEVPAWLRD